LVVLIIVGGALALVLPALLLLAWIVRTGRWLSYLAAAAYLAAVIAAAVDIGRYPMSNVGVFGWPAQVASGIALAALLASVVVRGVQWTSDVDGAIKPTRLDSRNHPPRHERNTEDGHG
jgi:hypothetical protein